MEHSASGSVAGADFEKCHVPIRTKYRQSGTNSLHFACFDGFDVMCSDVVRLTMDVDWQRTKRQLFAEQSFTILLNTWIYFKS